ncbi:MAG: platelet-activating factor acetylhydrolase IB subunit [Gemmatales bacterium]
MLRFWLGCAVLLLTLPSLIAQQEKGKEQQKNPAKKEAAKEPADASVTPKDRKDKWWQERHEKVLEQAKAKSPAVLFIGDSITQGWGGAGKKEWEKRFEPMNAINLGFSGDRTQHVLWRLTEGKEMDGYVPKVAMIMIGTNNSGNNSAEQIADGIEAIVKLLRKKHPRTKVLLLAVFPRGEKPDNTQRLKLIEVNKKISKLDDGKWVTFLDIGDKFLDKDGKLPKDIMPDFLHLSEKGYGIWADAVEDKLKEMVK